MTTFVAGDSETVEQPRASWPREIYDVLRSMDVTIAAYVPDGGHAELIQRLHDDPAVTAVPLTTEEEGVALVSGAWIGGRRGVLLMQSSGVGNCVNMLSLVKTCRFPLLALVTMRGEWGEFNPWQVPMGSATQQALELMDVKVFRASDPSEVAPTVEAATRMAFLGGTPVAVLLSQKLIGAKVFTK
ncbi:thiamine pyrophosphate-binding protein [Muricoccus pecuniae]|uniref:Sulfopyruvate decarboxylase alpha subunit n=1 Tax=Muricoccus pecuniae TaxID=693023 RepID=A0A840Y4Y5_9PROT|nr:thiamine pyrophosphate-binding protein [Roseomonas pecuniae]MBB5693839.1 sulfopyruvate decarboxylase alpha subunit [Roseomonas pecuniae]